MSKKIIIALVLVLAVSVVFSACSKKYEEVDKVTNSNGEEIIIYADEEGNKYVENKDGDKVAIGPDEDGFYDDLNSLIENPSSDKKGSSSKDDDKIIVGDGDGSEASIDWNNIASVS